MIRSTPSYTRTYTLLPSPERCRSVRLESDRVCLVHWVRAGADEAGGQWDGLGHAADRHVAGNLRRVAVHGNVGGAEGRGGELRRLEEVRRLQIYRKSTRLNSSH